MKISVIIPTYNEESVILNCLHSLEMQSFTDFEVIVVDDGSTDSTPEKINTFKDFNIKFLKQSHKGAGAGRNLGSKQANGEILVFVDADMTFDRNFLKMLVKPIIAGKTKGTNSIDEYVANWNNVWSRCWNLNEGWEPKKRHPEKYSNKQTVFRAILKSEFDKVGGFTPGGYNDDWSLSQKLGILADVAPKAIFFHKNPESLGEIFNHAKWVGKRKYRFGLFGYLVALIRSSLPVSIIIGLTKAFFYSQPMFLIFKVVYDFGLFVGIINYMVTKKGAK